jgi:hypothetical protein
MADVGKIVCPICEVDIDMRDVPDYNVGSPYGHNQPIIDVFGHLKIRLCQQSGFGFATPNVPRESPRHYGYRKTTFRPWECSDHVVSQFLLTLNFCDVREGCSMLDIGCGKGMSFHITQKLGF